MKRAGVIISVLGCLTGSLAWGKAPWGEHRGVDEQLHGVEPIQTIAQQENAGLMFSVLPYVLSRKPVRVEVDISHLGAQNDQLQRQMEEQVEEVYRQWFDQAILWVSRENREEFEDILPVLRAGVPLQFVKDMAPGSYRTHEVTVVVFPTGQAFQREIRQEKGILGLFKPGGVYNPMQIFVSLDDPDTWAHEFGHSLGFADEEEETHNKNASRIHQSNRRSLYSVMQNRWGDEGDAQLPTCADAEGLVNLLDAWTVRLAKRQHPQDWPNYVSERITKGWKSLEFGAEDFYLLGASVHTLFKHRDQLTPVERRLLENAFANRAGEMGELSADEQSFAERLRQRN